MIINRMVKRGQGCLKNGKAYEVRIAETLGKLRYKNKKIVLTESTAGATDGPDIVFRIGKDQIALECKTKDAFEGGGKHLVVTDVGLQITEECFHKELLNTHIPWNGRVPSFLKGDKSIDTYETERKDFPDEYIDVPATTVSSYYAKKSVSYIHIENYGLYHTGEDILGLGVPYFSCDSRMRIRYKCHGKTKFHMSVQASFTYKTSSLKLSHYDILTKSHPMLH